LQTFGVPNVVRNIIQKGDDGMVKFKRVGGKIYKRFPGAPALWFTDGSNKRYSNMELEAKRERLRKRR